MKAFVTGASGFIGGRLVRRLLEKGYQVNALVRSPADARLLRQLGAVPVRGDILDRETLRFALPGNDVVFHVAGWYRVGSPDSQQAEAVNVEGTRNVLELAYELGIPRIIYTSTVAVFGNTRGLIADERTVHPLEYCVTEYDRSKWKAHYEVAVPLLQKGAPLIILQPGVVYGPGDHSLVGEMMVRFYRGEFPIFPAPEMALTFAHVDDIVEGHILAAEKGRPGETYVLAGPIATMRDMVELWAQVSGRPAPLLYVPPALVKPVQPLVQALSSVVKLPPLLSPESIASIDATYLARSDKARRELGWKARPLQEGMRQTFEAIARQTSPDAFARTRRRQLAGLALLVALITSLVWWLSRERDD